MKQTLSRVAFLICILCGASAYAADAQKQRKLAECNFETEKVLVLYRVIYEGSRLGKDDEDIYEGLEKRLLAPQSAEQRKRTEQTIKDHRDRVSDAEEKVRLRLLDMCMKINGLSFDLLADDCRAKRGKAPPFGYYDIDTDCWK